MSEVVLEFLFNALLFTRIELPEQTIGRSSDVVLFNQNFDASVENGAKLLRSSTKAEAGAAKLAS